MEHASIIAVHNDTVSSDISYNDPVVDYIVRWTFSAWPKMMTMPAIIRTREHILGRWNEYNVYPESAKDKADFERFENVGFKEMGSTRLLYKIIIPDM